MSTADELISPDSIRRLAVIFQETALVPHAGKPWRTARHCSAPLGLGERARTVGDALLADCGRDYEELARVVRRALNRDDLTGWTIWPVTEAVAVAATTSGTGRHFDDGLDLLARLTPRLTGEFALRTFLNADLDRLPGPGRTAAGERGQPPQTSLGPAGARAQPRPRSHGPGAGQAVRRRLAGRAPLGGEPPQRHLPTRRRTGRDRRAPDADPGARHLRPGAAREGTWRPTGTSARSS